MVRNEILKTCSGAGSRIVVKIDSIVDALVNRIAYCGVKTSLSQTLVRRKVALIEELVAWNRNPVDVAKPAAHAYSGTVFRFVDLCLHSPTTPQLRKGS